MTLSRNLHKLSNSYQDKNLEKAHIQVLAKGVEDEENNFDYNGFAAARLPGRVSGCLGRGWQRWQRKWLWQAWRP